MFSAYVVSFLVIGVIWLNHHAMFANLRNVDGTVQVLNLLPLLLVTTIPFSTRSLATFLLTGDTDARVAAAAYGLVIEGVALSLTAICGWSWRARLLLAHITASEASHLIRRFGIGSAVILSTVAVALANPPAALAKHAGIALFYAVDRRPTTGRSA